MSATALPTRRAGRRFRGGAVAAGLAWVLLTGVVTSDFAVAQVAPAPTPSLSAPVAEPPPRPTVEGCPPEASGCHTPSQNASPSAPPSPSNPPCAGMGCLPQVPTAPPPAAPAPPPETADDNQADQLSHWLTDWFWDFFADLARGALGGVLDLLGTSLLATPQLDQLPAMGQAWGGSQQIMIAVYALVVVIAGIVVMAYQTLQTRSSIREILPRLTVGFLAANLSLFFGGKAIEFANALSQAVLGDQAGLDEATKAFTDNLRGNFPDGAPYSDLYVVFTVLALVVMIIAVMLTYIVRITLTIILLASAPLVLMCHALPQTEAIALWWWKAFGGVLAIQIGQSLAFVTALKLFYLPGGISLF